MAWKIIQVSGGTVTLPWPPDTIIDESPVIIEKQGSDGGGAVAISRYVDARKLTFQGNIWLRGTSNATLESTYLAPLRAMRRKQVTISDPDSQYAGTWLMDGPVFTRNNAGSGSEAVYAFTLGFWMGTQHVVL